MTFAWPYAFVALVLIPVMALLYRRLLKGRAERAALLAAEGFRPSAASARRNRRRHVPYAFFFVGLSALIFSFARPQATITVPNREGTVVLAFDISNSMRADDLKPTRIDAAKVAAKQFVDRQPRNIKVGVVAFNDGAVATQQPSSDKMAVKASIDRMTPSGSTSIGQGLFTSLNLIAGKPIGSGQIEAPSQAADGSGDTANPNPDAQGSSIDNIDIGFFGNAAIVLLSDGEDRSEVKPTEVAKLASLAGVKVYPIGIGSPEGTVVEIDGFKISTALDEPLLQELARVTDGTYFNAADADSLAKVYGSIDLQWKREPQKTEITAIVAAVGGLLLAIGSFLSLLWTGKVV